MNYDENYPYLGLKMRSPYEFIAAQTVTACDPLKANNGSLCEVNLCMYGILPYIIITLALSKAA